MKEGVVKNRKIYFNKLKLIVIRHINFRRNKVQTLHFKVSVLVLEYLFVIFQTHYFG